MFDIIFCLILMYVPLTTFLPPFICLNENEKRQWGFIYFVCKYSE